MYKLADRQYSYEAWAMETDRLRLSIFRPQKAGDVTDYFKRNRKFHAKWAQTHNESYFTKATQKEYIKYDLKEFKRGFLFPLWITLKDQPDVIVGRLSFFNFAYGGMMSCAIGYHLDEKMTGNGYMQEAIDGATSLLMEALVLHRIEAFILPENEKSIATIKRCGFKQEGIRYSYMHINGKWRDHLSFYKLNVK